MCLIDGEREASAMTVSSKIAGVGKIEAFIDAQHGDMLVGFYLMALHVTKMLGARHPPYHRTMGLAGAVGVAPAESTTPLIMPTSTLCRGSAAK